MSLGYSNPGWINGSGAAINATNLNAISNALQIIAAAFDGGADPAVLYGGTAALGSNWTTILQAAGANPLSQVSGAVGTVTVVTDTTYVFTATGSITLPAAPLNGCTITVKNKTTATTTINANAGQTIGTTSSTAFLLYTQEDYVRLQWDGTSIWYVVATNGPVLTGTQNAIVYCNGSSSWTAMGNGVVLASLGPGVYDFELDMEVTNNGPGTNVGISIGNASTPISNRTFQGAVTTHHHAVIKGYCLVASATINGLYFSGNVDNLLPYNLYGGNFGVLTARRIG